jgi:histidinol-phosphate/aromatic aminotransferase/cobyric acid decarboxylase-like protein
VPGKSAGLDGQPLIKLSANENPLGTSGAAVEARAQVANTALYPDPDSKDLRAALAALHGLDPARIVMGTGSDELLHIAAQAYAGWAMKCCSCAMAFRSIRSRRGAAARPRWKRPTAITAPMSTRCSPP